jgi:4-amino-4-deoxy-L-arabinose transferase
MILARPARLLGLFLLFVVLPLGWRPLWIPDESRYAEIAREMLAGGNWVVPHLLGLHYFEKPVAGYWTTALAQWLLGENLFASRLPLVLGTALSALTVGLLAQRLWHDARKTQIAVLMYLSFALVAGTALYITLDPQLTCWLNLALLAFHAATTAPNWRGRLLAWTLVGAACGLGFLTKGFLAWLLPVLVALPYMLWQRRLPELLRFGPLAVAVALAVAAPWALAVHQQAPDFWNFFFWNEHIRRLSAADAQHGQPVWYYLPVVLAGCLPWSGLLLPAMRRAVAQMRDPRVGFLVIWLAFPLVFFTAASGKMPAYVLVCFTPLALLLAHGVTEELDGGRAGWFRANAAVNAAIALIGMAGVLLARQRGMYGPEDQVAWLLALAIAGVWLLFALAQWWRPLRYWELAALPLWLLWACLPQLLTQNQIDSKEPSSFIRAHLDTLRKADILVGNDVGLSANLAWELKRTDIVVYARPGELEYGLRTPAGAGRFVAREEIANWLAHARRRGSVALALRVDSTDDPDLKALPQGAMQFEVRNKLVLVFYSQVGAP